MTPEEYEQLKNAEKEHLTKLKELKKAVRVLERQKKIQSDLQAMSRASDDALQAQSEAVERLAMETAYHEARLEVAMDSAETASRAASDEALEDELRSARAQALIERLKHSMENDEDLGAEFSGGTTAQTEGAAGNASSATSEGDERKHHKGERQADGAPENPTPGGRPEKTIGRM